MATFEERLAAIELEHAELKHDNAELKQKIELQTIAIGALVNNAALERLNERHDKLFESLIAHDNFTNQQLAELREQQSELDGKIVGVQTEMRQSFETMATKKDLDVVNIRLDAMDKRFYAVDKRFYAVDKRFDTMDERFDAVDKRFEAMDARFDQIIRLLTPPAPGPEQGS